MELESLKRSWAEMDSRIKDITSFNEKLVENIISSRVRNTIEKLNRLYYSFYVVLTVELAFMVALFIGNPFDFRYDVQYVPFVLLTVMILIAFIKLAKLHKAIRNLSPTLRIDVYLNSIFSLYDRNKRYEKWFGVLCFSIGLTVPFSFIVSKIEKSGWNHALLETLLIIGITLLLYFLAFKLGAFRNYHKESLEKDFQQWNELRSLTEENH